MSENILRQSWSRIHVDLDTDGCQATVSLLGGGTKRKLIFTVAARGEPFRFPPGYTAGLHALPSPEHPEEVLPIFATERCRGGEYMTVIRLAEGSPTTDGVFEACLSIRDDTGVEVAAPRICLAIRAGVVPPSVTGQSQFDEVRDIICIFGGDRQRVLEEVENAGKKADEMEAKLPDAQETLINYVANIDHANERLESEIAWRKTMDDKNLRWVNRLAEAIPGVVRDVTGDMSLLEGPAEDAVGAVNEVRALADSVPERLPGNNGDDWIRPYCFYRRTVPGGLVVSEKIKHIGDYAFAESRMSGVTLPEGLKSIGAYAFAGWDQQFLTIPASVVKIGDHALDFGDSINTAVITFKSPDPIIPCPVMDDTWVDIYYVPVGSVDAYQQAWPDLASKIQAYPYE